MGLEYWGWGEENNGGLWLGCLWESKKGHAKDPTTAGASLFGSLMCLDEVLSWGKFQCKSLSHGFLSVNNVWR